MTKVIHHPALGDQRPTAMMDYMLALLPEDEVPGSLFLGLFLERLPVEMRDHLVAQDFKNPVNRLYKQTNYGMLVEFSQLILF